MRHDQQSYPVKVGDFRINAYIDRGSAENDLRAGPYYAKAVCSSCQQYVEKILKEKLVEFGYNPPPKSHNLTLLASELSEITGVRVRSDIYLILNTLSRYYMDQRYPGVIGYQPTQEDAELAMEWADYIVDWLESIQMGPDGRAMFVKGIVRSGNNRRRHSFFGRFRR